MKRINRILLYETKNVVRNGSELPYVLTAGSVFSESMTTVKEFLCTIRCKWRELSYFERISLEILRRIIRQKTSATVYIGYDTCRACKKVYPLILRRAYERQKKIYYYNIILDREINSDEMGRTFSDLNVNSVPVVLFIEKGKVEKSIYLDNIPDWLGQ